MTLDPLLAAAPVVQIHALAAALAVALGVAAWLRRSRDGVHRALGWAWVASMALVAGSAAFIFDLRVIGPFSPIHLLIPAVFVALWRGVSHARAGRIAEHRREMTSLYIQALGLAGLFSLFPGRTMSRTLFPAAPWAGFALSAVLLSALAAWHLGRERRRRA